MAAADSIENNDYLEIKYYTYLDNQLGENVFYGKILADGGPGPWAPIAVANALSTWLHVQIKALIANPALYLGVSLRYWSPGSPNWATVWSKLNQGVGNAGATPCPKQCSGIFSKNTALAGQKNRGRTFVPFPATADTEPGGNPTASYLTRLTAYAQRVDNVENIGADYGIAFGLFTWRMSASFRAITECVVRDRFATQKRRGDYGRVNAIPPQLV
jgi:hypothetical protein